MKTDVPPVPPVRAATICGAVDLGGTKMEARLFGPDMVPVLNRRRPTVTDDFGGFIDGLAAQIDWLLAEAGNPALPIGISAPGITDAETGASLAANIPLGDQGIGPALSRRYGRPFHIVNDGMAFTYSEAHGGSGDGCAAVLGLVMGTGLGAGFCIDGQIPPRLNALGVEIGHVGVPGGLVDKFGLPLLPCGCGRVGCFEAYLSGTGLARLSEWKLGRAFPGEAFAAPTPEMAGVLDIWQRIAGECLHTLQLTLDPECIVLGGGLSNLPSVVARLEAGLAASQLSPLRRPIIRTARFGDSSGVRGAALIALAAQ